MILLPIAVVIIAGYIVLIYNNLQTIKTRIKASIQEIGNQLKRQASLIPNLTESAKGYLEHEKGIFDKLTDARKMVETAVNSGSADKMMAAQDLVQKALNSLRVVVESNPQIKGAEVVNKLMDELRDTADKMMYSRRTLIDLSADYNKVLVTFPSNIVAGIFSFKAEEGLKMADAGESLQVETEETKSPKVNLN